MCVLLLALLVFGRHWRQEVLIPTLEAHEVYSARQQRKPLLRLVHAVQRWVLRVRSPHLVKHGQRPRFSGAGVWRQRHGDVHLCAFAQLLGVDWHKLAAQLHHAGLGVVLNRQAVEVEHQRLQEALCEIARHDHRATVAGVHVPRDHVVAVLLRHNVAVQALGHAARA